MVIYHRTLVDIRLFYQLTVSIFKSYLPYYFSVDLKKCLIRY